MPVLRSQKSTSEAVVQRPPVGSGGGASPATATGGGGAPAEGNTGCTSATEPVSEVRSATGAPQGSQAASGSAAATSTAEETSGTRTEGLSSTTGETATDTSAATRPTEVPKRSSRTAASRSSRKKQKEKVSMEILQLKLQIAEKKLRDLNGESDEDYLDDVTVREDRTAEWVRNSTLALNMEPHNRKEEIVVREYFGSHTSMPEACVGAIGDTLTPARDPEQRAPHDVSSGKQPRQQEDITDRKEAFSCKMLHAAPQQVVVQNLTSQQLAEMMASAMKNKGSTQSQNLPEFYGASSAWLSFKKAFEATRGLYCESENLIRLQNALKGPARDATRCLFTGTPSCDEVMQLLANRFGRPDALVIAEMDRLRALPRLVDNPKEICEFANTIANTVATVKSLNRPHYLYSPEVVRQLVEKIPSALRHLYYKFAKTRPVDQPGLVTLMEFFNESADECGGYAPAEKTAEERRERATKKAPARTYVAQEHSSKENNSVKTESSRVKCPVCDKDGHTARNCGIFEKAETQERWTIAKQKKLCFRCLRVRRLNHFCKVKKCDVGGCETLHHPLLHSERPSSNSNSDSIEKNANVIESSASTATTASTRETISTTLLKIVPVEVIGPKGSEDTFALLDDGSTCTLIANETAEKVGTTGTPDPFYIEGVAGARVDAQDSKKVRLTLRGRDQKCHEVTARTMKDLKLSPQSVPRRLLEGCEHLRDVEEHLVYEQGTPTVLIGQDNWHLLLTHDVRRGGRNQPVATLTDLGWVLHGRRELRVQLARHRVNHNQVLSEEEESMQKLMEDFFALESLGVQPKRSHNDEERRAMQILEEKTRRLPAGGFTTGLLWKVDRDVPPPSYNNALRRLELVEKKLDKDEALRSRYTKQIENFIENGYAEEAPIEKSDRTWYLPHFGVINPHKPEKLRIVHDAAAKSGGRSLNDMLLSGPDLLQSLPGVLMRFRQRPVAVTGDIKDMFLRVQIIEEDRDMQRFLWRGDRREGPPKEYRMKSVIFGATSSPCTAIYVKNRNAEELKDEYPDVVAPIVKNHYMDDYLDSFNTEDEAILTASRVAHVHLKANFSLQRWASNSRGVRDHLAPDTTRDMVQLNKEKILGMVWEPETDTLSFNINRHKIPADILDGTTTPTKREALRTVMSLFDPLGLATPITIQAKRILQDVWRSGIDWDDRLERAEDNMWKRWIAEVRGLSSLSVPRCYQNLNSAIRMEIHTFVDASTSVYAAVVYWRVIDEHGDIHISLIASKAKVAPLKIVSIPRLELQAAVPGNRLVQTAIEEHDFKPVRRYYWTDSRTVLAWIRNGPRVYKPFVAHRIAELAETTKTAEWRWVPTKMNVADDATREIPPNFSHEHRWYRGPDFLHTPEEQWPIETADTACEPTGEERVHATTSTTSLHEALPKIERFSSWLRLIRTTARVLQFIDKLRTKKNRCNAVRKRNRKNRENDGAWQRHSKKAAPNEAPPTSLTRSARKITPLPAKYLHRARQLWIVAIQRDSFEEERRHIERGKTVKSDSRLSRLSLIIDEEGIIRLRSRIAATENITAAQREPAVIDGRHPWTRLYIAWVHQRLHHGGFETTANEVRQHYWVVQLRNAVRSVVKKCQQCRVMKARPSQPSTGNHPHSRLAHHQRPFTYTGLDYFGPMAVTVGRTQQKRYGVLFTCLTTRAVHIEIASSLTTDSAVMALRRFINRRGCPTELWSDHGTNLKGADVELKKAAREAMEHEASVNFIQWRYIPPSAPFMGGAWERLVRSVKTALSVTLKEKAPREEVLATLLVEAENTINSRPLTHVSTSADDEEALTPNHFILGGPSRVPLPGTFNESDVISKKHWKASQQLADVFWSRWVREYLPELQHRREPHAKGAPIDVGNLVLIADGTLPRNSWPRGEVIATYPGPDGEVRAVDVRTNKGVLRRPTKKLVVLPVDIGDSS